MTLRNLRLLITGATGFIGRHTVASALARGHSVIAVGRDEAKAAAAPWAAHVQFVQSDLHAGNFEPRALGSVDTMIHLAWPGLSDFRDPAHVARHLPADIRFLERMLESPLSRVLVAGTCLEYGIRNGALSETMSPQPSLPYATAKDALRRLIDERLPPGKRLIWARLFYMYGPGQSSKSVLGQLDEAIDRGDREFPMSGGEQLRDYLPVTEVARRLVRLAESRRASGVFNICSGQPISIRRLVEERVLERGADIELALGRYPYPDYEAMAFWGDGSKYQREVEAAHDG